MYFMIFHVLVWWKERIRSAIYGVWSSCALHACHGLVVISWPRLQNGDKMLCVEPLDRIQIAGLVTACKQDPKCHSWLSIVFICFQSISSAPSWPPASSSIINHRSSWYSTTIYNRHVIVSTLGLYAPGSAFRFQAHSPSLQQVCGQDSPRFVGADGFLFLLCKKHEYNNSVVGSGSCSKSLPSAF